MRNEELNPFGGNDGFNPFGDEGLGVNETPSPAGEAYPTEAPQPPDQSYPAADSSGGASELTETSFSPFG